MHRPDLGEGSALACLAAPPYTAGDLLTLRALLHPDALPDRPAGHDTPPQPLAHTAGHAALLAALGHAGTVTVLDGSAVAGTLTVADLDQPPVALTALSEIVLIESGLAFLADRVSGGAWVDLLGGWRLARARRLAGGQVDSDRALLGLLSPGDRLHLAARLELHTLLGPVVTAAQLRGFAETASRLRTAVSNGDPLRQAFPEPADLLDRLAALTDLAVRMRTVLCTPGQGA